MPFDFTAYTINKLEEQGKDASALKAEQKTFTPDAPSPVETPTVNRDSFDSSVRNAYKSRALEQQLADLNKQNTDLTNLIGGLSRAQSMGASEIIGAKRKEYEGQQSSLSEQISQLTAKLEAQKKANWTAERDRKKADAESLMSVFGAKKYTPEDYASLASKAQDVEVALALDENRRNKDFETTLATGGAAANSYLGYLTDTEKNTLANFVNLGQMDKAKEYLGNIKTVLTAREREEQKKAMVEGSKESPIAGAFLNTVSSFATPISYLATAGNAIKEKITGEYTPVDTNSSAFLGSQMQEDTQEGIHQAINDKLGTGKGADVANFLADTALSIGQFASKVPMGATGALAYMATGAAGQSSYDTLNRGGSASQAALIGTASGIIEALTEKIPLDNLFKIAKGGGTSALKSIAKQAGIEAGEEAISEVANNIVDIAAMGDNSEFRQYIEFLKTSKGMSQSQAEAEAIKQFFVVNTAKAAAGGAVSGGLMAGGANIVNSISTRANANMPVELQDNAETTETPSATTTLETPTMQESATQSVADENTYEHPHGFLLKETPDTLYREVGADRLLSYLMPKSDTTNLDAPYGGIPGIYVAKSPEFAIGQDGNDGVMLEFDNKDVPLVYNDKKPFNTPNGEYLVDDKFSSLLKQQQYLRGNLKKISISPKLIGEVTGEEVKNNFDFAKKKAFFNNRVIPTVEALGWTKTVDAKGNLVFSKPQSVVEPIKQTATVETHIIAENKKQATEREILERANAYTDEYFKPLDEIESQDEIKQWQRIRNKMKEKFAAEQGGLNSEPQNAKYSIGNVVRVSDGTEGVISEVSFGEDGKPYYSVTDEKGNSSSAIKEFLLSDISAEKSRRDAFLATITNKAQKTKAEAVLKDIKAQKFIDGLAQNPNSYSSINTTERAIKDGKGFSKNEYRIYSGENDGKSYYRASKPEYDYYEFVKGNATANTTPEGMGAASQGYNIKAIHGSQYASPDFRKGAQGAIWFSDNAYIADAYATGNARDNTGSVSDVYLSIQNPYTVTVSNSENFDIAKITKDAQMSGADGLIINFVPDAYLKEDLELFSKNSPDMSAKAVLKQRGLEWLAKDGETIKQFSNRIGDGKLYSHYAVFTPSQVKLANDISEQTNTTLPEGMGAASSGFSPYSQLQNEYGTFAQKENPARVVDVPLKDMQGRNVSGTAQTVMEAEATPTQLIPTLEQAVVDGDFSYDTFTDKAAQEQANSTIQSKGFQQALNDWTSEVRSGKVNKSNTALGWTLYDNAANMVSDPNATAQQKDEAAKAAVAILTDMQAHERNAAQALQAQRMLKKMSPTYQLYALQRSAQSIADELTAKYKKQYDIAIAPELVQEFISAVDSKDADAQKAVEKKIRKNIASQIPSTFMDKWNAWRYLAMLGNPRTHIRNIVGNAGFMPVRMLKNAVAASVETGAQKVGLINERSKSILTLSKTDRALMSTAWSDYNNVVDVIQNGGKYDDARSAIDRERTIFGLKPVEAARTVNTKLLDAEDRWFSQPAYAESLASYLKANKIAAEQFATMKPADKSKAQEYAIKESQKATYRDHNDFSDFIARLGKNYQGDNKAYKVANTVLEGVLPFKRTPANILSRVVEYSPIELAKSITYDVVQVKKGNMSATDMIDHLASGLVGTGLVALGAYLASQGLLSGGGSGDDKQDEFDELQGKQNYAITIGDKTFTLDWLAPEAVPVFVGVEIFNKLSDNSNGGSTLKDILESLSKITDPMLEMSMLQGVQDVIEGVKYSESPLVGAISNAAMGYLTQAAPTLFGQIERSFAEDTRQTTFTDKDSGIPTGIQYMLGKTLNKVPFVDYAQTDYIDAWGRKQSTGGLGERSIMNFLSPAYKSEKNTTEVDAELQRLYDTGATSVLPQRAESTVTINGTKLNLSKEDFKSYATTKGQTAFDTIQSIISSKAYQNMFDDEKAAVIDRAYAYADYKAKSQEFPQYKGDKWLATVDKAKSELGMNTADYLQYAEKYGTATMSGDNIREAYRAGIKPDSYLSYYTKAQKLSSDKDENGKTIDGSKRGKILVLIDSMNISNKAKDYLYYANGYSAKTINEAPWR